MHPQINKSAMFTSNQLFAGLGVGVVTGLLHYLLMDPERREKDENASLESILWGTLGGVSTILAYPVVSAIFSEGPPKQETPKEKPSIVGGSTLGAALIGGATTGLGTKLLGGSLRAGGVWGAIAGAVADIALRIWQNQHSK